MSGAVWSVLGSVVSRGFTFLSSVAVARILGKEGFGLWGLVLTTVSTFSNFAGFGISMTATKYVAELRKIEPQRASKALSLTLLLGLISITVMCCICILLSHWMAHKLYDAPELSFPLMLSSLILFGMVAQIMLHGALAGFEDFKYIAQNNVIQGIVYFVTVIPLSLGAGLKGTIVGMAISQWTAFILCLIATMNKCEEYGMKLSLNGIWQEKNILWEYAAPGGLIGLVNGPASMLSQAMVAKAEFGIVGLGGFNACAKLRDMILFVPAAVKQITLPMLSRLKGEKDHHRFVKTLWANIGMNGGIALAGALPVMVLSPWILSLFGPGFSQDWDMLVILSFSAVVQSVNNVLAQLTACTGRVWLRFGVHIVWGLTLLTGSYYLVPMLGVRGYAWSLLGAIVCQTTLNIIVACRIVNPKNGA